MTNLKTNNPFYREPGSMNKIHETKEDVSYKLIKIEPGETDSRFFWEIKFVEKYYFFCDCLITDFHITEKEICTKKKFLVTLLNKVEVQHIAFYNLRNSL